MSERFCVRKLDLVSDHLSSRFFIYDKQTDECYDVRHLVSEGYEVQHDTWAEQLCILLNSLYDEIVKLENSVDLLQKENEQLNKFFLFECKTQDFIEWVKQMEEEEK